MRRDAKPPGPETSKRGIWSVIAASSGGTVIEWYDFYIFGALASTVAPVFYPPGNDFLALVAYLTTFAVGFIVRPFGAIFFGRIGDLVGRKRAFLVTLLIMGTGTALVGVLPGFATIGYAAPVALILIRILQGLALGGEYGGAAIYVAEHVPEKKRGYYTSFIQITGSAGLFVSLAAILLVQSTMSEADFDQWGWRLCFLLSIVLVFASLYIRLKMRESPLFTTLKESGKTSSSPVRDSLGTWPAWKRILVVLFGATAGSAVVWYTGQFYALFYMQNILLIPSRTANIIVVLALIPGMFLFPVMGRLSDRIGRKKIMMAGCALAAITYIPIYRAMEWAAGNDVARVKGIPDEVTGAISITALTSSGDPATAATNANVALLVLLVFVQVLWVTMIYGPLAAYLVEAFPAKVRYTSLSLPYHVGNGIFGGLLPLIGLALNMHTGSLTAGLWYPIAVAALTAIVGSLLLRETHHIRIWDEVSTQLATDLPLPDEGPGPEGRGTRYISR
jgi:MFS family permease